MSVGEVPALSQALSFSLDVQQESQGGTCMKDAIKGVLTRYPEAVVGDTITFTDGSEAILVNDDGHFAFRVKEIQKGGIAG